MPMYNLLEYSKNYKKKQVVYGIIIEMNQVILFLLIVNLFKYKTSITGNTSYFGDDIRYNTSSRI